MPRITANSNLSCVSHTAVQQTSCQAGVAAQLRGASETCEWTLNSQNSPLASSALLDYDIRSLELPNGGRWPRPMIPELSQRHRRLPHWLPTIQLGWVIGCGWGVVVQPNKEPLGMCPHTADGTGGGKSRCGKRDSQDNAGCIISQNHVWYTPTHVAGKKGGKNMKMSWKSKKFLVV